MTWVIAHRGASHDERENTIASFERALAIGVDFVELDVQASADGELVVFHDTRLDRLTPFRGPLRLRTSAELAEHAIPTLAQVVELARGRAGLMAELKSPHLYRRHDLVARTVAMLDPEADVVLSFQRAALLEARRLSVAAPHPPARRLRSLDPRRRALRAGGRVRGFTRHPPWAREGAVARFGDGGLHGERRDPDAGARLARSGRHLQRPPRPPARRPRALAQVRQSSSGTCGSSLSARPRTRGLSAGNDPATRVPTGSAAA